MTFAAGRPDPNLGAAAREARAARQQAADLRNAARGQSARDQRAEQDRRIADRRAEREAAAAKSKQARQAKGIGVDAAQLKRQAEEAKRQKAADPGSIRFRQRETAYDRKAKPAAAKAPPAFKAESLFGFGEDGAGGEGTLGAGGAGGPMQGFQRNRSPMVAPFRGQYMASGNPAARPRGRR